MKKRRMMKKMLVACILMAAMSSALLGQSQYGGNLTQPDDNYIQHREIPESILEKLKNTASAHRLRFLDDGSIQKKEKNPTSTILKSRAVEQPVRVRSSTPTNTLMKVDLTKPVFDDNDEFGFAAIAELQKSAVTEETLKKAILASGHMRAGAPLEKSVLVMSDGTRMEVDMPVGEDGAMNMDVQFEHGGQTYAMTNLRQRLVGFYAGTNITQIGAGGLTRFDNLVQVDAPAVTNIQMQGLGLCPNLLIANFPLAKNIDIYAFIYDGSLKYVNMPNLARMGGVLFEEDGEVTPHGNHFTECTSLEVVDFPNLVSIDGTETFYGCENLRSISLPKLETVPFKLLTLCYNVKRVDFSSATNLQYYVMGYDDSIEDWKEIHPEDARNYEYTYWGDSFKNSSVTQISLPSMLNVDANTFRTCQLTEIRLPSATNIADYAFYGSTNLKKVYAPNLVTIGYQSMYDCYNLLEFDAKNLQKIGNEAFMQCRKLREVHFPLAHTVGERAFKRCNQLGYADLFSANSIGFETFFSCYALSRVNLDSLEHTKAQSSLPQNRNDGFAWCYSIEEIRLPNAKILGSITFSNCNHLKKVVVPSCEEIWRWCFYGCRNLEELFFCDGYGYGVTNVVKLVTGGGQPLDPFAMVSHKVNVIVPDTLYEEWRTNQQWTVENVNIYSWSNYQPLRSRDFASGVKYAEYGATNFVFSPREVRKFVIESANRNPTFTIDKQDWYSSQTKEGIAWLDVKVASATLRRLPTDFSSEFLRFVVAGQSGLMIQANQIQVNGPALVKITFRDTGNTYNILHGGKMYPLADAWLEQIPIVEFAKSDVQVDGQVSNPYSTFMFNDGKQKGVILPLEITRKTMQDNGFIDSQTGDWDTGNPIVGVRIGDNSLSIGTGTFSNLTTLVDMTISDTVAYIDGNAFSGCNKMKNLYFGSGTKFVDADAFNGCTSVMNLYLTDLDTYCNTFFRNAKSCPIASFQQNTSQGLYDKDAFNVFLNGQPLTNVVISSTIHQIGQYTFYNWRNMTSVTIPNSVTNIGQYGSSVCTGLKSVSIPGSVKYIGGAAFSNANQIENIEIGEGCEYIGSIAMWNLVKLTSLTIPSTVKEVGQNAFLQCSSLTNVVFAGKTTDEVQQMQNYPWGISNTSIIKGGTDNP